MYSTQGLAGKCRSVVRRCSIGGLDCSPVPGPRVVLVGTSVVTVDGGRGRGDSRSEGTGGILPQQWDGVGLFYEKLPTWSLSVGHGVAFGVVPTVWSGPTPVHVSMVFSSPVSRYPSIPVSWIVRA